MVTNNRKYADLLVDVLCIVLTTIGANSYFLVKEYEFAIPLVLLAIAVANILPFFSVRKHYGRIRLCNHGVRCLKIFAVSTFITIGFKIYLLINWYYREWQDFLIAVIIIFAVEALIFFNGIFSVYLSSLQLGIKIRILGIVFGMTPIINLIFLAIIIKTVSDEVELETGRHELNEYRKDLKVCQTKYPILLVHGVFFRDFEYFNYWGRIPKELIKNGATIYYGEHRSAASIADSANELATRIKQIIEETGCEKLNIIAHSKGGLDCRYAIENCGIGQYVASLTTINTPHRGCKFADYVLEKMPDKIEHKIAKAYNTALSNLGDVNPDFMSAVYDLTSQKGIELDKAMPVPKNIYCQSVGSKINKAIHGKFPLNLSYHLVKYFDGANDGLVGEDSFAWSDNYTFLVTKGRRGISHADIIDLNRSDIPGFDVREWYVQLVSELRIMDL
ncbi:MAG: triacylglycerol lipase [Lachnospiraceae bacterium]|nr:triacylglycerol lipase [Lachnospiraceae bacterium]